MSLTKIAGQGLGRVWVCGNYSVMEIRRLAIERTNPLVSLRRWWFAAWWCGLAPFGCYSGASVPAVEAGGGTETQPEVDDDGSTGDIDEPTDPSQDVAPITMRRLNRTEYDNTIRDLFFGLDVSPAEAFPAESSDQGFDNQSTGQNVTPLQAELYERAARDVVEAALEPDSPARDRLLVCDIDVADGACVREIMIAFAERAWRRPVADAELDAFIGVVTAASADGEPPQEALKLGIQAVLLSPLFLFRVELPPDPETSGPFALDDFALASRLSYFMWSTMPDDQLFAVAREGRLTDPDVLGEQVERMLASPKAEALVSNFGSQWLLLRVLRAGLDKSDELFPSYDADLGASMAVETELFFRRWLEDRRPLGELLTADYTFVNARLAAHYGLDTAEEEKDDFVEVSLADLPRRGVLTHAGILAANAHPNATSPTRRGMWVLQQLLCTTTPEPPADVDTELDPPGENETRRQQLDRHRQDPACAGCHSLTDPLGLAFETYDAIGAWRDQENGIAIDPSGELPGGVQFRDAIELSTLLAEDPRYAPCVARKVLSYALGRRAQSSDNAFIDEVLATAEAKDGALASVIEAFIQTPPFHTHPGHTEEGN